MGMANRFAALIAIPAVVLFSVSGAAIGAGPGAGGGTGAPTAPTAAQRAVGKALREFGGVVNRTCEDLRKNARRTGAAIAGLDRDGAADDAIVAKGDEGKARTTSRSASALARVTAIKDAALAELAANAGTQEQIDRVTNAATAAAARIDECATNSSARIDQAVAAAIAD